MKRIAFLALLAIFLFGFNGCGYGSSEKNGAELQSKVITENDLFANPQIKATYQHTIVIQHEHPDGEEVPVYYSKYVSHTFCWEDDTSGASHSMELIDSGGKLYSQYITMISV